MAQDWFYKLFINECKAALLSKQSSGSGGQTPVVGENGNWWVGDTDTGIVAVLPEAEGVSF